jgi:hypothetical protein
MLNFRPGESPSWQIYVFDDADEARREDCTGAALDIDATNLGFTPALAWSDRAAGAAVLSMTTQQTATVPPRRSFWIRLRLQLPGGEVAVTADIPILSWRGSSDTTIVRLPDAHNMLHLTPAEESAVGGGPKVAIRFGRLGARGLPGPAGGVGPAGPQGDPATNEDPGDLTLIFDNQLI